LVGRGVVVAALIAAGGFLIPASPAIAAVLIAAGLGIFLVDLFGVAHVTPCLPNIFGGSNCPFGLYIDPSGNVVDTSGNPIGGATATLLSHGLNGFATVDPASGAINPANNPETTASDGSFDWEALAGTYEVQASAPNCHAPGNPSQPNVTTSPFVIPPPAVGLLIALECPGSTPPIPTVTGVFANLGSSAGGNRLEIMGTGLADASSVHFGSASATGVTPISTFAVAATVPPGTSTVDVTVTTPGGTSAISSVDHYTYVTLPTSPAAPSISSVTPGDGPVWGGTNVAIKGSNLDGVWSVSFGGVPALQVTDVSTGEVDAIAPASLTSGPVDVTVTQSNGTSSITGSDRFKYTLGGSVSTCTTTGADPVDTGAITSQQYHLSGSDGANWQEIDPAQLRLTCLPSAGQSVLVTANADLWTANAGYNQDIAIFVSDNGGGDQLLAWKESGGFAGTFSPNAAYVQQLFNMTSGHTYVFKLKWKTNKPATGATIYAGAGSGPYSPTSLVAETFPTGVVPNVAVSTTQHTLSNSDGSTWQSIDATNLKTTLSPSANSTAVLGANADLFTANAGYNQDIGIFVSDNGGADALVAWKESGGFAGTFSPNAAFVKATYPMTGGHSYVFKLKWKTNKPASGATIFTGAGPIGSNFSPTSLFAATIPAGANPYTAVSTIQYSLSNSDGTNWQLIDPALNVTVAPGSTTNSILGANADLWTANAGYNQDIGIFVSDNGGADVLLAWKESGGFAGTFSPNAAFAQATFQMTAGHTYVFKLKWKTNKPASGATIYAAAGGGAPFSPTRLTVELTS
jgi:hypothetical protein